jgi:hypothetical protein
MKRIIRLTESDLVRLVKKVINEKQGITSSWESKYTDWATNKSGNPELAMQLMSRYWDLKNHPEMPVKYKDFNNLKDANELQDLIDEMEEAVRINKLNQDITRSNVFRNSYDRAHAGYYKKHNISVDSEARQMRKQKEEEEKRQERESFDNFVDYFTKD